MMAFEHFHHVLGYALDHFALPLGELSNEVAYQKGNIALSFP